MKEKSSKTTSFFNHSKYFLPSPGRCEAFGALFFSIHFFLYVRVREKNAARLCPTLPENFAKR